MASATVRALQVPLFPLTTASSHGELLACFPPLAVIRRRRGRGRGRGRGTSGYMALKLKQHTAAASRHPLCCLTVKASVTSAEFATEPEVANGRVARTEVITGHDVAKNSVPGTGVPTEPEVASEPKVTEATVASAEVVTEPEFARGYTMTQLCDKMIDFFMNKKPKTKDWRKLLVHRDDWKKYKDSFYDRCRVRIDTESDSSLKKKLVLLSRKIKKIDDEIEKHMELFKELEESPLDISAVVAKRRNDFTDEFFQHLNVLADAYSSLDRRDAIIRLGAKCLSAVRAYDCTLQSLDSLETAQSKFDEILNSASLEEVCSKINSLAKSKELDSSLILLINRAWAAAKESTTMKNEVKEIMYQIYKATQKSLRVISPPEIRLIKHLLNIEDPDERIKALGNSFTLDEETGDDAEPSKDPDALYTTPKKLHKWITTMLDAYHLNKEETDLIEARKLGDPLIIQRLIILKQTIEQDYLTDYVHKEGEEPKEL